MRTWPKICIVREHPAVRVYMYNKYTLNVCCAACTICLMKIIFARSVFNFRRKKKCYSICTEHDRTTEKEIGKKNAMEEEEEEEDL